MLLKEKLKSYKLLLASKSPRRRQLIAESGLEYVLCDDFEVDELFPDTMPAEGVPVFLSELKSDSYPNKLNNSDILITADTVVILDSSIIGKPSDRSEAIKTLQKLSGRCHTVVTGVTLRSPKQKVSFTTSTNVYFKELSIEEIEYYVDTFAPYDKAGAYGIQEWIGYVAIERIEGSFYNVMGLPIQKLHTNLNKFIEL